MNSSALQQTNNSDPGNNFTSDHTFGKNENDTIAGQTIYFRKVKLKIKKQFYFRIAILLAAINLLIIINSFGQLVTVNNLSIANSAQITIKGDLLNNAGATINNSGEVSIIGDFTNNSGSNLFGSSSGIVTLNGVNQNISGTDVTIFYDLNLAGTGTKTLQQNITTGGAGVMNGVLSLGDRQLDLNSKELTISNASSTAITRTTGFVISETTPLIGYGSVKWLVQNNAGTYIFPFGNAATSSYLPVTFEINQAGTGANGFISLATYPTTTSALPNNRPLPTGLTSLIDMSGSENAHNVLDRWWVMDVSNYTTNPLSSIEFTYRDSEWDLSAGSSNTLSESALQAQSNNGAVWIPQPIGVVNITNNTVTVTDINVFNPYWTIVGNNNPLPVSLLTFNAALNKKEEAVIDWATATEINNDYFTVEKSRDGINFEGFASVDGAGNSTNVLFYETLDKHPYEGTTYYRLKQTDFDGQFTYSEVKAVKLDKVNATAFQVYPNPASDHFYVKFDEESAEQSLVIIDINGKVVREINIADVESPGSSIYKIERLSLEAGMYFITTTTGKMQKLVLQ